MAVSENTAQALTANQRIPASRIQVVPNGVSATPVSRAVSEARDHLRIPRDVTVLGTVGRLARIKGQDRLIRAFAAMENVDDCRLVIVGDGPERAEFEELAAERGVADRVTFAGFRQDARACLAALDLFVLPSRNEGLPVALLEAMAEGVPVLATPVGEVREVLEDGLAGGILPDDESAWPAAIASALGDRSRTDRARSRVRDHYSLDVTLAAYESLYANCGQRSEGRNRR